MAGDDESRDNDEQEVDLQHASASRPNFYLDLDDDAFEDRDDDADYTFSPEEVRAQLAQNMALSEEPEEVDEVHLKSPDVEVEGAAGSLERLGLLHCLHASMVFMYSQALVIEL